MKECIDDSSIHLDVDSTVRFDVAPAKSAHYISMGHRPCGAWAVKFLLRVEGGPIKGGTICDRIVTECITECMYHSHSQYTSLKENCLQTLSGQTLFSSLHDVVIKWGNAVLFI